MALRRSLKTLQAEGFRRRHQLRTPDEAKATGVDRELLDSDRRNERGPFDILGDVHGCRNELVELLGRLGYTVSTEPGHDRPRFVVNHPDGRRVIFTGDLTDRGPDPVGTLALAMDMTASGHALVVQGNHDAKLAKALAGHEVEAKHGLAATLEALGREPEAFREQVQQFPAPDQGALRP